jgi:hypothetical protein
MLYRIKYDYETIVSLDNERVSIPLYKEFTDAKEANDYIQNYLATESFSICGVTKISDDVIELYFDVV